MNWRSLVFAIGCGAFVAIVFLWFIGRIAPLMWYTL